MNIESTSSQNDARIISRFSTAILSCTLLGMTLGHSMPIEMMKLTMAAALISSTFFFYEEFKEIRLKRRHHERSQQLMEMRLQDHTLEYRPHQRSLLEEAS